MGLTTCARGIAALPVALGILATPGLAQSVPQAEAEQPAPPPAGQADGATLAKQLANPISSLISVPFQENIDFGIGPDDGVKSTLNIQPVIPFGISKDWNVIVRTILPVVYQDADVSGDDELGLGDTLQSFFFSPKRATSGGITWGVGPALLYPSATDRMLGAEKWGAGPTAVVLRQTQGWTSGVLANHVWSFAGKDSRAAVSQTFVQPFMNYTWPTTVGVTFSSEATYDWKSEKWTVPLNLAVSKVVRLGVQRASIQVGGRYYVSRPDGGPDWGVRVNFTLLFPRG